MPAQIAAFLAVFAVACTTSTTTTDTTNSEDSSGVSRLKLLPTAFQGDTPCSAAPGSMRSYVASLYMADDPDKALVTSTPVSCGVGVLFDSYTYLIDSDGDGVKEKGVELVSPDRKYTIGVQGFEAFAADLDLTTSPTARWTASCGSDASPIIPRDDGATLVEDCTHLVDAGGGATVTSVMIDPQATLGTLACAGEGVPGQKTVATFDILSENGLGDTLGLPCDAAVEPIVITGSKLKDGKAVSFYVGARESKDGPLTWGARCSTVVAAGIAVTAACMPLTADGAVRIDLKSILGQSNIACGADFSEANAVATVGEVTVNVSGLTCDDPRDIGPFPQGPFTLDLTVPGKDGKPLFEAKCEGSVDPGRASAPTICVQQ